MLSLFVIMFAYHVFVTPFEIQNVTGVMLMILLAWFTAVAVGLVFLAIKPWSPGLSSLLSTIYQRANMIASGKMFVANTLTPQLLNMFDWNPLFHCIDQSRGYAFVNYAPRNSSWEYAFYVGLIFLMIGMMGEFYTRKHASASWSARRLNPASGFGIQRVYTDDGQLDETMAVSDGDVVCVPRGHHPCGAPYGFEMYYLNVMAGPKRKWRFVAAPEVEWIMERDA